MLDGLDLTVETENGEETADSGGNLPESDTVEGEDLDGVPRYPESKMTLYYKTGGQTVIHYVTDASISDVAEHHRTSIEGWTKGYEQKWEQIVDLFYSKGEKTLSVTIMPTSSGGNTKAVVVLGE